MKRVTSLVLYFVLAHSLSAQTPSPVRPKILETSPAAWQVDTSPNQKKIEITFDQKMSPSFTAWLGRSSLPPTLNLDSKISVDRQTFSLSVAMEPAKVYVFALNEKNLAGVGFQNETGPSALPFFLVFQTTGSTRRRKTPRPTPSEFSRRMGRRKSIAQK